MHDLVLTDAHLPQVRNALVAAMDVASGARGKATYYHSSDEQAQAVCDHIAKLYQVSKELPLIVASMQGTNGFYIQEALLNEFKQTTKRGHNRIVNPLDWDDERLRDRAVSACLDNLDKNAGIPYVLRMFKTMKDRKINNRRSRGFALRYILGNPNLEFVCVKYRAKVRDILTHAWGEKLTGIIVSVSSKMSSGVPLEEKDVEIFRNNVLIHSQKSDTYLANILLFVFGSGGAFDESEYPVISQWVIAHTDVTDCHLVPEEILKGLLSNKNHPQHESMWGSENAKKATLELIRKSNKVETANQSVRKTKQNKQLGIEVESRVSEADDPIALLKTCYENGFELELVDRLSKLAKKNRYHDFPYQKIGIILDSSPSMKGHRNESKNTPRAISDFTLRVLRESASATVIGTDYGDMAGCFIRLMGNGDKPEAVFVLSDGYENSYDGLLNEVVTAWHKIEGALPVFHISPLGFAETNAKARGMGSNVLSLVATHKTLPVQMQAHMLEADTKLWLTQAVARLAS